ncbi:MAG: tetratricopeptide repeat protein [Syntrophaceae bacterium]|nr:tetratricopeptide repeat protein [Syntrophaceae bacterium]
MTKKKKLWIGSAFLSLLILIPYLQMHSHEFIIWDDPYYIYKNPIVSKGLSLLGIGWAFITVVTANWHPITWISHMLDSSLFGPTPLASHMVNILLYSGCVLLSFLLFSELGASIPAAFFMAAFWGLHPLHVESVAWASERKDLLCAFFFLSALLVYLKYTRKNNLSLYLLTTALFLFSLFSKPMAVTWPCVVFLLDYWPLQRFNNELKRVIYEKIPWIVLSIFSSIATIIAQSKSEAIKSFIEFPLTDRVANAAISYLVYIRQTIWPSELTIFYPYPYYINTTGVIFACLVLGIITLVVTRQKQNHPYLLFGWLFYLGVLFPVIGIIQVGIQAHADRYMLLPQLGLILAAGLFLDKTITKINFRRFTVIMIMMIIPVLISITFRQVSYWKDNNTLFHQNLMAAGENELAHFNLGSAYLENNEPEMAISHLLNAAKMNPTEVTTFNNLGIAYTQLNNFSLAAACFKQAILLNPEMAQPHFHLAVLKFNKGLFNEAVDHLNEAVRLAPDWVKARNFLYKAKELASKNSPETD